MFYLKHSVQLAPYIWDWYAWSHLLPPHTAAANIARRHLAIIESFIDSPELHEEAINSGLLGGPFMHLDASHVNAISRLRDVTLEQCASLLELDKQIHQLNQTLQQHANGMGMEALYNSIPDALKGLVELVYDLSNSPQIRFIEQLVYDKYFDTSSQSICLTDTKDDKRTFCFSTPYIEREGTLKLPVSFSDNLIDDLVIMKYIAGDKEEIWNRCQLPADKRELFDSLFTTQPPASSVEQIGEQHVRVRYFGHACVLIETQETSILIDPALGYPHSQHSNDRYTLADLPAKIDYVLITHNHQDHFLFETLLQLRHKVKHIVVPSCNNGALYDPSMKLILKHLGFKNIISIDEFDDIHLGNGQLITALPFLGEHGDLNIQTKRSYYIRVHNKTFLFLADSNNLDKAMYEHIYRKIGKVDVIFIGMECVGAPVSWLYGPLFAQALTHQHDQQRRLSGSDYQKAWDLIRLFGSKEVYIYAMGMEPWLGYVMAIEYNDDSPAMVESAKLISQCVANGMISRRLYGKDQWHYQSL